MPRYRSANRSEACARYLGKTILYTARGDTFVGSAYKDNEKTMSVTAAFQVLSSPDGMVFVPCDRIPYWRLPYSYMLDGNVKGIFRNAIVLNAKVTPSDAISVESDSKDDVSVPILEGELVLT